MRTLKFRVPFEVPTTPTPLELLERAWPEGTEDQIQQLFDQGKIQFDERATKNPHKGLDADWICEVEVPEGSEAFDMPDGSDLARGEGWVIVEKTVGIPAELDREDPMNSVLFLADMLGFDRDTIAPVWEMPILMGGPFLLGLTADDAARLRESIFSGRVMTMWSAICPELELPQGQIEHADTTIDYGTTRLRDGLAEVQLTPQFSGERIENPVEFLLEALAAHDAPVVGDRERGGYMAKGALRLRLTAIYDESGDVEGLAHSWPSPEGFWPNQPIVPPPPETSEPETTEDGSVVLYVSRKTIDVLENQGHPWVLEDRETGSRDHLAPGSIVRLQGRDQRLGPYALVEGTEKLAARVWSDEHDAAEHFREDVEIRFDEAVSRRAELQRKLASTDLFRLVHGQADGLPAFFLDRVGPILRATIAGGAAQKLKNFVYESIADLDPDLPILEVAHLEDIRRRDGELPQARIVQRGRGLIEAGDRVIAREHGLKYWCEPWEGIDTGFFADQRDNRARLLASDQSGTRWLNLFCHTGAFTVALASRGASVVSNDISKNYLRWLEENLDLNGLGTADHEFVADDARSYLKGATGKFDGIIVDPPTAAQSDAGFWSVRKDYQALLTRCIELTRSQGTLLVCRNDRRAKSALEDIIRSAAADAGRDISLENAPPAPDYPRLSGFPEGDSFEACWVTPS